MFNYSPQNQLDIFNFKTDFESKLDPDNRWVKMAETSQYWIAAILFVMNILKLTKEYLWAFIYGLFFNRYPKFDKELKTIS